MKLMKNTIQEKIKKYLPPHIYVVAQGDIVASSLADYLSRHPEIETSLTRDSKMAFYTTDDATDFDKHAAIFFGGKVKAEYLRL